MENSELEQQFTVVSAVKNLDFYLGIQFPHSANLLVLLGDKPLLHGGEFHKQFELGKVKIRRDTFHHTTLLIPAQWKTNRFVAPLHAIKIKKPSQFLLAFVRKTRNGPQFSTHVTLSLVTETPDLESRWPSTSAFQVPGSTWVRAKWADRLTTDKVPIPVDRTTARLHERTSP